MHGYWVLHEACLQLRGQACECVRSSTIWPSTGLYRNGCRENLDAFPIPVRRKGALPDAESADRLPAHRADEADRVLHDLPCTATMLTEMGDQRWSSSLRTAVSPSSSVAYSEKTSSRWVNVIGLLVAGPSVITAKHPQA